MTSPEYHQLCKNARSAGVPEHMHEGLYRYLHHGIEPGDFLRAILCNDYYEACKRADQENLIRLASYARFLYNYAPIGSFGSKENYQEWISHKGFSGLDADRPKWTMLYPGMTPEHLGYIPQFLSLSDDRPAAEQIDAHYGHGGGWRKYEGFTLRMIDKALTHEGDPDLLPLAMCQLRDEEVYFYPHSWVMVLQANGSYEIARID